MEQLQHQKPLKTGASAFHSCDICGELIEQLIWPSIDWVDEERGFESTEAINFGWLDSVIENEQCSLCRLVARIFEQTRVKDTDHPGRIYCFFSKTSIRPSITRKRRNWSIGLDFYYPTVDKKMVSTIWQPSLRLLASDSSAIGIDEDVFELGRVLSPGYADAAFLRACFDTCVRTHGAACNQPVRKGPGGSQFPLSNSSDLPVGLRVIDIQDQRVIHAPTTCRYVVLSYVWGSTNFLQLTKETEHQLQTPGILRKIPVPKTISNSIEATGMIGARYLWVDSLCILQDDEEEKVAQIQKMDKIYANSLLTIVAAGGTHADAGLWDTNPNGVRVGQIREEVHGLNFISAGPDLMKTLEKSVWIQRAWTYQEYILSRRLLVFGEYQAYYSCESAGFAEDYVHRVSNNGTQELQAAADDEFSTFVSVAHQFPTFWPSMIRQYTNRSLSFDSDGLNALSGVLQNFSQGINDGFLCGLPVSTLFEAGLLWVPSRTLRKRGPTSVGSQFPSWSWVGWVGEVSFEVGNVDSDAILDARVITEWSVSYEHGILQSTDLHFPSAAGQLSSSASSTIWKAANSSLQGIQTGYLCFTTKSAMFTIEESYWNQFVTPDDFDCEHNGLYKVLHEGTWIGSVHLEHSTARNLSVGPDHAHEFIVLARSGGRVEPLRIPERPQTEESNWIPLFDESLLEQYQEDVYDVMLVIVKQDVAYRRGIGQIHKDSWDNAGWQLAKIQLG